jgi:hypothetical protein
MDEAKFTARPPTLDVEMTLRKLAEENAGAVTIQMKATPVDVVAEMDPTGGC